MAAGACTRGVNADAVIEAPAASKECVKVRNDLWVRHQVAKGLAMRVGPGKTATPASSSSCAGHATTIVAIAFIPREGTRVRVHGVIERRQLVGR